MDFATFQMQVFAYLKFEISVFRLNAKCIARYPGWLLHNCDEEMGRNLEFNR